MNLMNLPATALHVVESLANGTLQGMVILVLAAVAIRWIPGMNAATRHAVWFVGLLVIAALPVAHGLRSLAPATGGPEAPLSPPVSSPEAIAAGTETGATEDRVWLPASPPADANWSRIPGEAPAIAWIEPPSVEYPAMPQVWLPAEPLAPLEFDREDDPEIGSAATGESPQDPVGTPFGQSVPRWTIPVSEKISLALVIGWLIPAGLRLMGLMGEVIRIRRLKRDSCAAPAAAGELFQRIRIDMGVNRPVSLRLGPADAVPFVAGFRHPMVVLPEGYAEAHPQSEVAQVLRHELAHVRRGDDWTHLIEQGLRAVLWFHPGVHWIVRRLSLEREIACDDHVLKAAHGARNYALLLTGFARCRPGRDLLATPAVWNRKTQLKERITMILDSKRNASPRIAGAMAGLLMLGTAGLTGLVLHAGPQIAVIPSPAEVTTEADVTVAAPANVTVTAPTEVAVALAPAAPVAVSAPRVVLAVDKDVTAPKIKTAIAGEPPQPPEAPQPPKPAPAPDPFALPSPVPAPANINVQIDRVAEVDFDRPGKDKGKGRSIVSEGKGRGSLEERLERLERLVEKLVSREGVSLKGEAGSPDSLKFHLGPDSATIARVVEAAKKAAKDAKANLPDAEMLARIHKEAETAAREAAREGERAAREAAREGERAAREAERAAREAVRATQQAIRQQQQEKYHAVEHGKEARTQLEQKRRELEGQRRNLEREMESLERRMERLERDAERLEELEESRKEETQEDRKPEPEKKVKSPGKAEAYSEAK